ncbi:MAG: hypothetical protein K0S41_2686 [Anaerocolumna sp.]|jgi:uncharacterized membrane protein|nr:hypothetical protein [Anaerocolumna sp.]
MKSNRTLKIVLTALMAAMTCIATMVIKVPSPTGGYIHLGDGLVLLSGIILGPIYGGLAAGIGSMFADIFSGYVGFAAATLIIKALAAIIGSIVYHLFIKLFHNTIQKLIALVLAGICGGFIVTSGYFIFEGFIMGLGIGTALSGIPFNIIQNVFGIIVSIVLMPVLGKVPVVKEMMEKVA